MKQTLSHLGTLLKAPFVYFWSRSVRVKVGIVLFLVALITATQLSKSNPPQTVDTQMAIKQVSISSVAELSENTSPLELFGVVSSKNEATIRAESGGKIVALYRKLGDYAPAGSIIAEFENSREHAQVVSAEGAYESASLGKDIAGITRSSSDNALLEAKSSALNVISTAYTGLDDAVRTKTDIAWRNPQTRDAHLAVTISDAKLVIQLEEERIAIEQMLHTRDERNHMLTVDSDLVSELTKVESEVSTVKNYLDDLSLGLNRTLPDGTITTTMVDGYKTSTALARTSVGALLTQISVARNALNSAVSANKIAEKNSSDSTEDVASSASAALQKTALGNLRIAQSALEKTIIRSPISGTINSLSIDLGDYVSPYTEVAVISNNKALEIVAYVTENDAREFAIGSKVSIEGGDMGIITQIAPALDPKTKKIEVHVGIISNMTKLINGQSVRVNVGRSTNNNKTETIKVPISALKITPGGTIAFTVSDVGVLVGHVVHTGALLGDQIVISDGLTREMQIVTDARGLQDGMVVSLK